MKKRYMTWLIAMLMCLWTVADDGSEAFQLEELKLARERLENENALLHDELEKKNAELLQVRAMYADIILKNSETARRLTELELAAANLLGGSPNENDADRRFNETLQIISQLRRNVLDIENAFNEFNNDFATAIDALSPSESMKKLLQDGLNSLRDKLTETLKTLAPENAAEARNAWQDGCTVIRISQDSRTVFINCGYHHELRDGQILIMNPDDKKPIRLKIVECRPDNSAATLLEGDWNRLFLGCTLFPERIAATH